MRTQCLVARLPPSRRHPDGLPRCQRERVRDGRWHQCQRAAREGFRTCGFHGAGFAARERAGTAKNPALVRLSTGRHATLETLRVLSSDDPRAFVFYQFALIKRRLAEAKAAIRAQQRERRRRPRTRNA